MSHGDRDARRHPSATPTSAAQDGPTMLMQLVSLGKGPMTFAAVGRMTASATKQLNPCLRSARPDTSANPPHRLSVNA
jgi:hypothetical protein